MQQTYKSTRAAKPATGLPQRAPHQAHSAPTLPRKILQALVAQMID